MVGRENTGLFYRSLYGDLYGEARFGAVRRIRLRRVAMGVEGLMRTHYAESIPLARAPAVTPPG